MFRWLLVPVASNLFLSFLVGIIPILVVLVLSGLVGYRQATGLAGCTGWLASLARSLLCVQ
jgi:hypothetical protein